MTDQAAMPKLDLKTFVVPIIYLLKSKIDFTDENILNMARIGVVSVLVIAVSTYTMIYFAIEKKNDNRKIWVAPKVPSLPFIGTMGETKPEDFAQTTYHDHEIKVLKEGAQGVLMACGIAILMSFKFGVHISCVMQSVSVPLGLFDSILVKKYLLGIDVGVKPYGELEAAPSASPTPVVDKIDDDDDKVPKVEELDDEDEQTNETQKEQPIGQID